MASTPSRRRSDRHRGKAVDEGDMIESQARSSRRVSHQSELLQITKQPQVLNITLNNYANVYFGGDHDEPSRARSSPMPRPNSRVAQLKRENDHYISEDSESDSSIDAIDESHLSSRSIRTAPSSQSSPASTAHRRRRALSRDEGYGTGASGSGSIRSSKKLGKAKAIKSDYKSDLSRRSSDASLVAESSRPRKTSRRTQAHMESGNEDSETSVGDTHLAEEGDDDEKDLESDYEIGFEAIQVLSQNDKYVDVNAILDTGTQPDWVSDHFLKILGKKEDKLAEDNNKEYTDFNGRGFKATGKVDLVVTDDNFKNANTRVLSFLVTKRGKFNILLGRKTCYKQKLICRPPKDLEGGEGAFTGIQKGPKKEEKEHIIRRKAEQAEKGAKEDKKRVDEKKAKKQEEQARTMANFAAESRPARAKERNRSISPSGPGRSGANRDSKSTSSKASRAQVAEKSSSSSLDDCEDGGALL
ncbi:hypothetical protein B7494_g2577 [Chlorociboria aeruginascens]|nr:hypothetical protein B7494_g2577 [Chlorociboria aeruginascens]